MSPDSPSEPLFIGVAISSAGSYWMSMLRGIFDTTRLYKGVDATRIKPDAVESSIKDRHFSAFIARVTSPELRDHFLKTPVPVVNTSGRLDTSPFASVIVDDAMVGEMAARHLADLGLHRFAFCGDSSGFSVRREKAFASAVEALGKTYYPLVTDHDRSRWWFQRITEILREPDDGPLGVFTLNDDAADALMAQMRLGGLRVPDSVAVLGVDNEELVQQRCSPPLSSIEVPTYGIGCEAVHLAMRMLRGESGTQNSVILPPCRVVARLSTDILAVGNPNVRAAISFIRENSRRAITVEEVVAAVGEMTRRTIERHFVDALGTTLQDYIQSTRLNLSKELLADPSLSVKEVCYRGGFGSPSRFAKFFHRKEGLTPQAYRTRRLGTPGPDAKRD